jgi:hypothetical protein
VILGRSIGMVLSHTVSCVFDARVGGGVVFFPGDGGAVAEERLMDRLIRMHA